MRTGRLIRITPLPGLASLALSSFLIGVALLMAGTTLVRAGGPTGQIRIVGLSREDSVTRLRWEGGFPPFRVQFKQDLNGTWMEHPRPLGTNEFVIATDGEARFFQIRTECEPLEITDFHYTQDAQFLFLKWRGGNPPFRVEAQVPGADVWEPVAPVTAERHYEGSSGGIGRLIRIASAGDSTAPSPPPAVSLYAARCDRALIGWEAASDGIGGAGVTAYLVFRDGVQIAQLAPTARLFLDEGLNPGVTYHYRVGAFDLFGNESSPSASLAVTTPDCSVTETNLEYSAGALRLRWDRSEDGRVAGYVVHWGHAPGEYPWQLDAMAEDSVTITDLIPGRAYFISVTSYSVEGVESDPAPELIFVPPSLIEAAYSSRVRGVLDPDPAAP